MKRIFLLFLFLCGIAHAERWLFFPTLSEPFTTTYSILLDGTDESLLTNHKFNFERNVPFSVSVWLKKGATGADHTYFGQFTAGTYIGLRISVNSGNKVGFVLSQGNTGPYYDVASTDQISDTTNWRHVVVTYDGTNDSATGDVDFYINGSQSTTVDWFSAGLPLTATVVGDSNAAIGKNTYTTGPQYFNGYLGDMVITNWELTSGQVSEIYNSGNELDMQDFSAWSTLSACAECAWWDWETADMTGGSGSAVDRINGYVATPSNTESGDKVEAAP
jgi:hypothetical protein